MKGKWLARDLIVGPHLALCLTAEDFAAKAHDEGEEPFPNEWVSAGKHAKVHSFVRKDGKRLAIVCMSGWEDRDPICIAGLLVHEAVHVWQSFCEDIGERTPSIEFEAYSIQWIAQQLMWEFVRQTATAKGKK